MSTLPYNSIKSLDNINTENNSNNSKNSKNSKNSSLVKKSKFSLNSRNKRVNSKSSLVNKFSSTNENLDEEKNIIGHYLSKCCGQRISNCLSCFIGINLKDTVAGKYQRIVSFVSILFALTITPFFAVTGFIFTCDMDFTKKIRSSIIVINEFVATVLFAIIFVLFIIVRSKKLKNFDGWMFFLMIVIGFEVIDVAHICGNKGILSSNNISLLSCPLIVTLFVYDNIKIKIFFIIVWFLNNLILCIYDGIFYKEHTELVIEYIKKDYIQNMIICYIAAILPIILFIGLFFLKIVSHLKFLKKRVKAQEKHLEDYKVEEKEASENLAKININEKLFEIDYDKIKIIKTIGKGGSSSVVFEVEWNKYIYAFKCFKIAEFLTSQEKFKEFEKEANILASVAHPNILRFFGCTLKIPRIGIIMELCNNGDLKVYMGIKDDIPEKQRLEWLSQICKAMIYLHSKKIIHRDLKPSNVLLNDILICKIMDFGISRICHDLTNNSKTTRVGTLRYMSPEISIGTIYNEKTDVFSFGIMMYEILTNNFDPYNKQGSEHNIDRKVAENPSYRPRLSNTKTKLYQQNIMIRCWSHNPDKRPPFGKILKDLEDGDLSFRQSIEKEKKKILEKYGKTKSKKKKKKKKKKKNNKNNKVDDGNGGDEVQKDIGNIEILIDT